MDLCLKGGGFYTHIYMCISYLPTTSVNLLLVTRIFTQNNGVFTHYNKFWTLCHMVIYVIVVALPMTLFMNKFVHTIIWSYF
jgi:hypothetical protein